MNYFNYKKKPVNTKLVKKKNLIDVSTNENFIMSIVQEIVLMIRSKDFADFTKVEDRGRVVHEAYKLTREVDKMIVVKLKRPTTPITSR